MKESQRLADEVTVVSKLNPNSAPFNPREEIFQPLQVMSSFNSVPTWWDFDASQALNPATLSRVLTLYRVLLQLDLGRCRLRDLSEYLFENNHDRIGLISHPLAQLFIAPPRERYVHPAVTDACMYALRVARTVEGSSGKGKFCLAASPNYPGYENNTTDDWVVAIVALLYYGLPPIRTALLDHVCEEDVCWICELRYAFENTDQSIREGTGQPISIRAVVHTLTGLVPLSTSLMGSRDEEPMGFDWDIPHGLLNRKAYKRTDRTAVPLLSETYRHGRHFRREPWVAKSASRVTNGARIFQHDRKNETVLNKSRERVHFKLHQALNFVIHMLSRSAALNSCSHNEFPRLGETGNQEQQELMRSSVESVCYCPVTQKTSTVNKDSLLLPLNFHRWHKALECHTPEQVISPDSTDIFAFEDSVSSDSTSQSVSPRSRDENDELESPTTSPFRSVQKSTSTTSSARCSAVSGVRFVDLVADSLDRETRVQMSCGRCAELDRGCGLHTIKDQVTKLPVVLGIKVDVCSDTRNLSFWRGHRQDDVRAVVRKYCKYKRLQDFERVEIYQRELLARAQHSVLPSTMYIAKRTNGRGWIVDENVVPNAAEYSLSIVVASSHSAWERETRSTLWNIWKDDEQMRSGESRSRLRERLRLTEIEELTVERPPTEDTVLLYTKTATGQWLLVNGPLTCEVSESDVTAFALPYRYPVAVFYSRVRLLGNWRCALSGRNRPFDSPLPKNRSISVKRLLQPSFHAITATELKQVDAGRFSMAVDAEYVVTKRINKCPNHVLGSAAQCEIGRLSGIRAENSFSEPTPFADFYVEFGVAPIDYRHEYSGLRPEDLSQKSSTQWLTTRSYVYRFIRHMVKSNCQFIGHDLFNDFRVIGIVVPSNLIIDTVELFRLSPTSRMLSLKYLAWHVLEMRIQTGHHDSVEDSWASLLLYRYYLEHVAREGTSPFNDLIAKLYSIGYNTNFRAPDC